MINCRVVYQRTLNGHPPTENGVEAVRERGVSPSSFTAYAFLHSGRWLASALNPCSSQGPPGSAMAAQLTCPSVDEEGNDLIGNASTGPEFDCFYFSDEICLYDAAGQLNTAPSVDLSCPSQMVPAESHSRSPIPTSGTISVSSSRPMSRSSALVTSKGIATQGPTSSSSSLISSPPIPGDSPSATNPVASPTLSVAANLSNRYAHVMQ
ncbi:hypothetical protein B0H14DRAFT_242120 [Mycena olivaceomarginata]|nr:hypothetical protein B0H14DRAFT_242120 [Mycena olivaceomarginata]